MCKNYIGCNIKKCTFWSLYLVPGDFSVKDDQIKTIADLEGCNDDLSYNNIFGGQLCLG